MPLERPSIPTSVSTTAKSRPTLSHPQRFPGHPTDWVAELGGRGANLILTASDPAKRAPRVLAIERDVLGGQLQRRLGIAGGKAWKNRLIVSVLAAGIWGSIVNDNGSPATKRAERAARAADRLNLIRVMPAQGDERSARPGEGHRWHQDADRSEHDASSSARA